MRLYKKKLIRQGINREVEKRTESQDAILWDVLSDQHVCRVKIQGSDELVTAHFPENWRKTPEFLKSGSAVRITYVGGNRGRLEISGFGRNIPSPVYGSVEPPKTSGEDAVIEGCEVVPTDPASMTVSVKTGTYRIAGEYYTLDIYVLPETGGFVLYEDGGILLGEYAGSVQIDPAPNINGYFRYDALSIGTDGIITYTKGEMSKWPEVPDIPNQHVLLGTILLYYGMTEITVHDINREFYEPVPTFIRAELSKTVSYWDDEDWDITITVKILDQYENPIYKQGNGFKIKREVEKGTGSYDPYSTYQYTGDSSNEVTWIYTRDPQSVDEEDSVYEHSGDEKLSAGYYYEESVLLEFICKEDNELSIPGHIFLFDPDNDIIP